MTTSPLPIAPSTVNTEHRGWKLRASWLRSISALNEGWVCYVTRPASSQELNIGRWTSSELALDHGRVYVDSRVEAPVQTSQKRNSLWP